MPKLKKRTAPQPVVLQSALIITPDRARWAREKLRECITILRREIAEEHAYDLAEKALWSTDPEVRDARGYLEAWADVADVTVGQLIEEIEGN